MQRLAEQETKDRIEHPPIPPFELRVEPMAGMLNFEIADDPVYEGIEIQRFEDDLHGRGFAVLVTRREDKKVDVYRQLGISLDRSMLQIHAGVGEWIQTDIIPARLDVTPYGVDAEVRFADTAGRIIHIRIDDRSKTTRRPTTLLAPVGAAIQRPASMLLVYMRRFDLLRRGARIIDIRIGGRPATIGSLPGAALHHRTLVKYSDDMSALMFNPGRDGTFALPAGPIGFVRGRGGGHHARLELSPAIPDLNALEPGAPHGGRWTLGIDDDPAVIGGTWNASRVDDRIHLEMDVTEGWSPKRPGLLLRVVTKVVPLFRTWPTTYRWKADIRLGPQPTMTSRWERKVVPGAESYLRLTQRNGGQPT